MSLFIINAVNNTGGNNYFRIIGEQASKFPSGAYLQVRSSTGNNGLYKIASSVNNSGYTDITVVEPILSSVADGQLNGGVYQVDFSDATVTGKDPIVLPPAAINATALSIALPGRGAWDYGERLIENAVHMLEHFASATPPASPTIGQLWFDTANMSMNVFIGGEWSPSANLEGGQLTFKDPQNTAPGSRMVVTAAEPAGLEATGLTIYPEDDVAVGSPIVRVLAADGSIHFAVNRSDAVVTDQRFVADSTATNEFKGKVSIGTPTNVYTAGATVNILGNVDVSGRLVFDEAAAQNGLIGRTSSSTIRLVSGLWNVYSSNADSVVFSNDSGEVARLGSTNVFAAPVQVNNTLNVTGQTDLSTTFVDGTLTATDVSVTNRTTTAFLTVTGALDTTAMETRLLRDLNANGFTVTGLVAPSADSDAATKEYVDETNNLVDLSDTTINSPTNNQVLLFQSGSGKWINSVLDSSTISGFGNSVKDQAGAMITGGTHTGLTATYNNGSKTLDLTMDPRQIDLAGSVVASGTINWNGTTTISTSLNNTGVGAGTYTKVTVGSDGRVVAGGAVSAGDITPGNYNLQNTYKVFNAIDPVDDGDYVTLRFLQNYTFDAGIF